MTPASCPEYGRLESLEAREAFHARIALAEREGAIEVERARFGEERLLRLRLADLDRLAAHLGIRLLSDRVGEAAAMLDTATGDWPIVASVLEAWRLGRKVRGSGPEAARDLFDATTVAGDRIHEERDERLLRRESIRLFDDSKRLERLTPWLDLLLAGDLAPSGLSREEVWASLGLRRAPQPMLVSGVGTVVLRGEATPATLPLVRPYLGLPIEAVETVAARARYVLTIENLASFHDAAAAVSLPGHADGLLIYTAGMPSPAWRALYGRILRALPTGTAVLHWGDIDEGGFRIAASLASVAADAGRPLLPWLMSPSDLATRPEGCTPPTPATLRRMQHWARRAGWASLASGLELDPLELEQEALAPVFPMA
ncbi:Wadjet anti-phage system protein JetD domain-containing protein [Marilutibacter alkalisoli]|nr:Wadjet anti-phage system protein JetD domain-containing protein [Lysobacter alkalisoli]